MWDAVQSFMAGYGFWIILGLVFLVMMRGQGGGCCGMGHTHEAGRAPSRQASDASRRDTSEPTTGRTTGPAGRTGGCH